MQHSPLGRGLSLGLIRQPYAPLSAAHAPKKVQHTLLARCRAASADCSSASDAVSNIDTASLAGSSSNALRQQSQAQRLPVLASHNNAVPMHRNTAAAATAVAVAAAAAVAHTQYIQPEVDIQQLTPPMLQAQLQAQQQMSAHIGRYSSPSRRSSSGLQETPPAGTNDAVRMSRRLTKAIMACSSHHELQQLYQQRAGQLNLIHVSAMFKKLTSCPGQQQQQGAPELQKQQKQQPQLSARQQRQQWYDWVPGSMLQRAQQQQQTDLMQQLELHSLQLLSAVQMPPAGALQMLRAASPQLSASPQLLQPPDLQEHVLQQQQQQQQHTFSSSSNGRGVQGHVAAAQMPLQPQQLSTICWSCAGLGYQPSAAWWACYWAASTALLHMYSPSELATAISAAGKLQQVPPASWMAGFEAACISGRLADASPQELCMMLHGVAVLRLQPRAQWLEALQQSVSQQLELLRPRDISQVLWGHARLAVCPPAHWLAQVLSAASAQLPSFSARDAAMLLWALAVLGHCPGRQVVAGLLGGISVSSYKQKAANPQDFAHIAWALATFERLSPSQASSSQEACASSSSNSTAQQERQQQQQDTCAAAVLSEAQFDSWFMLTWHMTQPSSSSSSSSSSWPYQQQQQQHLLTFVDAAQLLWSASQLPRYCWPSQEWLAHFWSQAGQNLAHASAQSLTVTLWASCKLEYSPPRALLMAVTPVLRRQLAELQPPAACQLLYVLARLEHRPNPAFMEQLLTRLQLDSHQLEPRAFACVLWALGRLRYQPGGTWWVTVLNHLEGLVGQLGERELSNVLFGLVALDVCRRTTSGNSGGSGSSSSSAEGGVIEFPEHLLEALLQRAADLGVAAEHSICIGGTAAQTAHSNAVGEANAAAAAEGACPGLGNGRQPLLQQLLL